MEFTGKISLKYGYLSINILYMLLLLHTNHFFWELNFYMGIQFREDFHSRVINFASFFYIREKREIKDPRNKVTINYLVTIYFVCSSGHK